MVVAGAAVVVPAAVAQSASLTVGLSMGDGGPDLPAETAAATAADAAARWQAGRS